MRFTRKGGMTGGPEAVEVRTCWVCNRMEERPMG
jgi:hypothetical protein